ncbi:hypothetical protein BD310DRAFT_182287 [Dichomitus squalens]|uniref:Uncharacterized protein n=1 Tax=Dichomitus squalens TaxID=114155 RepID=A0A4Q9PIA7_9APHY|nr:hypothetical protein BD310DRAFT_182287 [Dichomitus squalens]
MCSSNEECEPSQMVGDGWSQLETLSSRRTRRAEVERGIAERRTSRLFASGGALDSQTSETLYIYTLDEPGTDVVRTKTYTSIRVQTDRAQDVAAGGTTAMCPCMRALASAQEELRHVHMANAAQEHRLQQMNAFIQDNTDLFLDVTQESQTLVDMPWLTDSCTLVSPVEGVEHTTLTDGKRVREDDVEGGFDRGHVWKEARPSYSPY